MAKKKVGKVFVRNVEREECVKTASGSVEGENAHMAIDIRVVDTASGRLVTARRIAGSAASAKATVGANLESSISSDDIKPELR